MSFLRRADFMGEPGGESLAMFRQIGTSPWELWQSSCPQDATGATTTFSVNVVRAIPFACPRRGTLDRIAFEVTTGGSAGSVARAGIYRAMSMNDIRPGALVVDGGEHDTTGTGVMASTITATLEPGTLYWLALLTGVAQPTLRRGGPSLNFGFSATLGANANNLVTATHAYGALLDPFPAAGLSLNAGAAIPLIAVRWAS